MTAAREKIIEAMARASLLRLGINPDAPSPFNGVPGVPEDEKVAFYWQAAAPDMEAALAAIAEQGYAVVPRECPSDARFGLTTLQYMAGKHARFFDAAAADIAGSDPADEAKP